MEEQATGPVGAVTPLPGGVRGTKRLGHPSAGGFDAGPQKGRQKMGNLRTLSAGVALARVLVWVGAAHAADPVVKCQEAKLKRYWV